jgi:DNA-directed RNA polymerase specialized sigma subunit
MGLFSRKPKSTESQQIVDLKIELKTANRDLEKEIQRNGDLQDLNAELGIEVADLKEKVKTLEAKVQALSPVKGKVTTLEKAILKQIAAFEEQASGKSDSEKMYGAFTVKGKSGRPILVEVHTVKEARDVIAKVKAGKLTLLSL